MVFSKTIKNSQQILQVFLSSIHPYNSISATNQNRLDIITMLAAKFFQATFSSQEFVPYNIVITKQKKLDNFCNIVRVDWLASQTTEPQEGFDFDQKITLQNIHQILKIQLKEFSFQITQQNWFKKFVKVLQQIASLLNVNATYKQVLKSSDMVILFQQLFKKGEIADKSKKIQLKPNLILKIKQNPSLEDCVESLFQHDIHLHNRISSIQQIIVINTQVVTTQMGKMSDQIKELKQKMSDQIKELKQKMSDQIKELKQKMSDEIKELKQMIQKSNPPPQATSVTPVLPQIQLEAHQKKQRIMENQNAENDFEEYFERSRQKNERLKKQTNKVCGHYDKQHHAHGRCKTCDAKWRYQKRNAEKRAKKIQQQDPSYSQQ